jgi:hypothetical protein
VPVWLHSLHYRPCDFWGENSKNFFSQNQEIEP